MSKITYNLSRRLFGLFDKNFREGISFFDKINKLGSDEIVEFRNARIASHIAYCYENVPYYREQMDLRGIIPSDIKTVEGLEHLPILTKDIIRSRYNDLKSRKMSEFRTTFRRSGGTTGEPIRAIVDRFTQVLETQAFLRGLGWMGWNPDYKLIQLVGGSLGVQSKGFSMKTWLRRIALNQIYLPAFELNLSNAADYFRTINKQGASVITGYPSAIYNLALHKIQLGAKCPDVKYIFTTAEVLLDEWASTIKLAFNCEIKSYYGCGEVESLGFQLEEGGDYVVPDDINYIESSNSTGIDNLFLITSMFNRGLPMLRYVNGDIGLLSEKEVLGRKRMIITELLGRTSDMFISADGSYISGAFGPHLIFKTGILVSKYQFIQYKSNEVEFRYTPENADLSDKDRSEIKRIMDHLLKTDVNITFRKTDEYLSSRSGKQRITVNMID